MAKARKTQLKRYFGYRYPVVILEEQGPAGERAFFAVHPDLPGCMSHGPTPETALENLDDARNEYLTLMLEQGAEVSPPPQTTSSRAAGTVQTSQWSVATGFGSEAGLVLRTTVDPNLTEIEETSPGQAQRRIAEPGWTG